MLSGIQMGIHLGVYPCAQHSQQTSDHNYNPGVALFIHEV